MQPRVYSLVFVAAALVLMGGVVGANLVLDPQGVLGTNLVPASANINRRFHSLAVYKQAPGRYDGLLFSSSRGDSMPLDDLGQKAGGATFASFAVNFGSITDHLPALEYVLKHKTENGGRLRAVFLMLDVDTFGHAPRTNRTLQTALPPEFTGESAARFWWKNLTAIQYQSWRSALRDVGRSGPPPGGGAPAVAAAVVAQAFVVDRGERTEMLRQLRMLQRFAALCRDYGVALYVAASPLSQRNAAQHDARELEAVAEQISRVVPLWDFSKADAFPETAPYWTDALHFGPGVAHLMLSRIFGDPIPPEWSEFGRLLSASTEAPPP